MTSVTVSPKFQIVIPKHIRETLDLSAGMKVEMVSYDDRIELVPVRSIKSLKGSLKGIDTKIKREKDRV